MRSPSATPLVDLLRKAASGDSPSLEDLLARLYRVIVRYLQRRLAGDSGAESLVEDAAVEALVRIAGGVESCRATTDSQLLAWTLAIARTASLDLIRREIAQTGSTVLSQAMLDRAEAPEAEALRPSVAADALLRLVQDVHDRLSDSMQLLLWLRLIEGASWAEVAEEIGTTPEGAKRRFQRGQQRLRREVSRSIHDLTQAEQDLVLERLAFLGIAI